LGGEEAPDAYNQVQRRDVPLKASFLLLSEWFHHGGGGWSCDECGAVSVVQRQDRAGADRGC